MSRRLIGYPTGWTLSVLDDGTDAGAAARDLETAGVGNEDLVVLSGADAAGLERLGQ